MLVRERAGTCVPYRLGQFMTSPTRRLFAVVLAFGVLIAAGCGSSSSSKSGSATGATATVAPRLSAKRSDARNDISKANRVLAGDPILAKYHVNNGQLGAFVSGSNKTKYREVWTFYSRLIPQVDRKAIALYAIFAPKGSLANVAGFVSPLNDVGSSWVLAVDPDSPGGLYELADTFIHETMHMLSLGADVPVSTKHCVISVDSLCPRPGSYLYAFIKRFWIRLLPQWRRAEKNKTIAAFYKKHASDFTREYAATSPMEDISESFAAYVLDRPEPRGVVAKENFFRAYPKLVAIKTYAQQCFARSLRACSK